MDVPHFQPRLLEVDAVASPSAVVKSGARAARHVAGKTDPPQPLVPEMDANGAVPLTFDSLASRATITVEQAAVLLGIGRTAAYDAARRGQLPTRRVGRRLRVPVAAFLEWLGAPTSAPSPQE